MGKKYIIELEDGEHLYKTTINALGNPVMRAAEKVPYTELDLERVKKESYEQGYHAGYVKYRNLSYEDGLKDAWEAAKKIVLSTEDGGLFEYDTRKAVFGCGNYIALKKYSVSEAIEKIRQYEQKREEITVGDEVKAFEKKPFIVTGFGYGDDEEDVYCYGFVTENGISTSAKKNSCVRTGRHFHDIDEIFKEMREPGRQGAFEEALYDYLSLRQQPAAAKQ